MKFITDFAIINLSQEGSQHMTKPNLELLTAHPETGGTISTSKLIDLIHRNPNSQLIFGWSTNSDTELIKNLKNEFGSKVYLIEENELPVAIVNTPTEEFCLREDVCKDSDVGANNIFGDYVWTTDEETDEESDKYSNPELCLVVETNALILKPQAVDLFLEHYTL